MDGEMVVGLFFVGAYFAAIVFLARSNNRRARAWLLFCAVLPMLSSLILLFAYPLEKDGELEGGVA